MIKEMTRAMGLVGVELDGIESDDLVAAQARMLANAGHEVLIVSADKDFAQCVDDRIKMLQPPPTANPGSTPQPTPRSSAKPKPLLWAAKFSASGSVVVRLMASPR